MPDYNAPINYDPIELNSNNTRWENLARVGDPNKQDPVINRDGGWTANSADLVGDENTPYLQVQYGADTVAFKILAEPQSGNFKILTGIFVDLDRDGSPDFVIRLNVDNVTGGYQVKEFDLIPIFTGTSADANTRPNNTNLPGNNSGAIFNIKTTSTGQSTNSSIGFDVNNVKLFSSRPGTDGTLQQAIDVDGDGNIENYYVISFTLAQLDSFRTFIASQGNTYKQIPQWNTNNPTKIYATALTASNSLNAVNGDVGGGAFSTSTSWKDILGFVPPTAPVANNDILSVFEGSGDTALVSTGNLLSNDFDANNDPIRITQFTIGSDVYTINPGQSNTVTFSYGSLTINSNGEYTFTRTNPNYAGAVPVITYTVTDGVTGTDTANFFINITPVNDAPTGANNTLETNRGIPYTFARSDFGFSDPVDGNPDNGTSANSLLSVIITSLPTNGTLSLNGNQVNANQEIPASQISQLVFTPDPNYSGTDNNFSFLVRDNGGTANGGVDTSTTANTISFNVLDINTPPIAQLVTAEATEAGGVGNVGGVNPRDSLFNNGNTDNLTISVSGTQIDASADNNNSGEGTLIQGIYGKLFVKSDGSFFYELDNENPTVEALNDSDELIESFTYTLTDEGGLSDSNTITITIEGTNDAPIAKDDFNVISFQTGTNASPITGNVLDNDIDVDAGDTLSLTGTTIISTANGSTPGGTGTASVTRIYLDTTGITARTAANARGDAVFRLVNNVWTDTGLRVFTIGTDSISSYIELSQNTPNPPAGTAESLTLNSSEKLQFFPTGTNGVVTGSLKFERTILNNIASSTPVPTTTINVSDIVGGIAVGMTVEGTDSDGTSFTTQVTSVNVANGTIAVNTSVLLASNSPLEFTQTFTGASINLIGEYGTLELQNNGGYKYIPQATGLTAGNYEDTFTYNAVDSGGLPSNEANLTVALRVTANAPAAIADTASIIEGVNISTPTEITGNVTSNDNPSNSTVTNARSSFFCY